jgi:hypothetical protein
MKFPAKPVVQQGKFWFNGERPMSSFATRLSHCTACEDMAESWMEGSSASDYPKWRLHFTRAPLGINGN